MTKIVHIISKCFLLLLAFTAILFTSCKREIFSSSFYEGDGRQVTLKIPVSFTEYDQRTRALTESESKRLDDLYLFVFQSSTGKLEYRKYYSADSLAALKDATSQAGHSNAKVVPVILTTGTYKIAAVANTSAGHLKQGVREKLLQIQSWDDFYNLDLELNEYSPITRSRLPMSGYYQVSTADCNSAHTCPDVVVNGQSDLNGYIHLRRVDAEVKFNIYNDIDGHTAGLDGAAGDYTQTCTKFEITGWQLVNMPTGAYLAEHDADKTDVSYTSTSWQGITKPDPNTGDPAWKLDFYMMENRKSASGIAKYEERELNTANEGRVDNEDPHFVKAPENSTYLKFSANIEITLTKGAENIKRIATATYYVHLGATYPLGGTPDVDYNDFNTARNTRYTYNVKVQGVDKIVVEALSDADPNDGFQNGQEGVVVDLTGGKVIDLDAHYAVFNIELSRREISQMGIIITSAAHPSGVSYIPDAGPGGTDLNNLNITCDDYQHLRFAPLAAQTAKTAGAELVVYSNTYDVKALTEHPTEAQAKEGGILPLEDEPTQAQDAAHYVPLYDFITLKKSYPLLDDGHDDDPITFTVFVSEYYYYNDYNLHHDTDLGEENWQAFTNTINRQYSLLTNVKVSNDEHSTHVTGKYVINQRSIQTYYGMDSEAGLGIEHVNEHYHKNMAASNPSTKRSNNGWFNSAFYMGLMTNTGSVTNTARWADWTSQDRAIGHESSQDFYPTFKTKYSDGLVGNQNYKGGKNRISSDDRSVNYDAIPACLARNRDLNRNGIIETNELRWFLPGIQQYVQFAIGIAALETPIFTPSVFADAIDRDTKGGQNNNIYGNFRYHFISSDNWKMWSEEGTSISTLSGISVENAWEIRCCRYLKANGGYTSSDNQLIVAHPYNHNDANRVVNVHGYDEKCIRENTAVLPVRDNFDTKWNSLARNFQYASTTITRPDAASMAALARDVDNNVYCSTYHDPAFGADRSDVGTWRIPNQRELAIMYYEGKATNGYFAGTFWYYGNYTNNIVFGYDAAAAEAGSKYFGNFGIRDNNLCLNHSNRLNSCKTIRCVRDTDSEGHYMNSPEYGKVLDFKFGVITSSPGSYSSMATMHPDAVVKSVTIDGKDATVTQSGRTFTAKVSEVSDPQTFNVKWVVEYNGKTYTYTKDWTSIVKVTTITLNKTTATLGIDETLSLTAAVKPNNATDKTVTWKSSDESVATVAATKAVSGTTITVTGKASGTATITAEAADGTGVTATCTVTVKQPVTSITLDKTTATINVNNTVNLTATVAPANATNKAVTWSSNSTGIATVSETGVVTGVAPGTATITATAADGSGVTATCTVTVKQPVTSITLPSTASVEVGNTVTLTPAILPENATNKAVTWSSNSTGIATVSNGVVTGKAAGTATITATAADGSGKSASCTVTVTNPVVKVTSITLDRTTVTFNIFLKGVTLVPTVKPDNATNKNVIWSTSNANVATVSSTGQVKSAGGRGTAVITATAADGSGKYATCTVTY